MKRSHPLRASLSSESSSFTLSNDAPQEVDHTSRDLPTVVPTDYNGNDPSLKIGNETNRPLFASSGEQFKSSWTVYLAVFCGQMSAVSMGATFGWSAPAVEDMKNWNQSPLKPNETEKNWIASVLTLGALFGAIFCGLLMDIFGRKKTLIGLGVPFFAGWLLIG